MGKSALKKVLLVLVALSMFLCSAAFAADKTVYVVGIDGDYPPYSYIGEDGKPTGFDVESVRWIAEKMGFEVDIRPTAWDGIIPALLAKKIDLIYSGMTATNERREVVAFTDVYWVINQAVCARNDSDLNMITALAGGYTVGTQRGCTAAMWLEDNLVKPGMLPKDNLKLYDNFPLAVTDLENGRIDAAMMDDVIVQKAVEGKALKILGTISTGEEYAVAVRKEDTDLLNMLNEGLDLLMKSPKWQELKDKYNM
ncbi:MAG TPA: ABC transporter substrate-binding protein [Synergistales bacterium]|nr:ABC transporter substrate-binding protein [Synergistales bacterium]